MANETYSLDDQVIGASYIILSVVSIIVYVPCLIVMHTDSELKNHSCLRIMFQIGISDLLHLTGEIICGFLSITGLAYTIPNWQGKLNNLLMNLTAVIGWNSYIILLNLLSFNRCVKFNCKAMWNERIFGQGPTTKLIMFCWFWAGCWLVFNLSPWGGMIYHAKMWVWYFDFAAPFILERIFAVLLNCIVHQVCIWLFCILAVYGFKKQNTHLFGEGAASETMRKKERSLLIQSMVICGVLFTMDQYWHNFHARLCPESIYCGPTGQYLMILNNAVNPFIYLTFNKTIQVKVLKFVGLKKDGQSVSKVIDINNTTQHATNK